MIDAAQRAAAPGPFAVQRRRDRPARRTAAIRTRTPPRSSALERRRRRRPRRLARPVGARAGLHGPGRSAAHPPRRLRARAVEDYGPGRIRPHERTHPGPKEDRLRLTRATRANLSPIFSLYDDPSNAAWKAVEPFTQRRAVGRGHRRRGHDAQALARGRPGGDRGLQGRARRHRAADRRRPSPLRDRARLPAGERARPTHVLMCLVALQDEGLTVFPTHRLATNADMDGAQRGLRARLDDRAAGHAVASATTPAAPSRRSTSRTGRSPTRRSRASRSPTGAWTRPCSRS